MDESQQVAQDRRTCRAAIQDVGEDSDKSETRDDDNPDDDNSQEEIDNQIKADIERCCTGTTITDIEEYICIRNRFIVSVYLIALLARSLRRKSNQIN